MKWQCTFCNISSKNEFDTRFTNCRKNRHTIIEMLHISEIKKSLEPTRKKTIRKVKGRIENYFVESILVDDKPCFLCYSDENGLLTVESSIETKDVMYQPVEIQQCGYVPYSFTTLEITELLTKKIDKESLLDEIKIKIDRFLSLRIRQASNLR